MDQMCILISHLFLPSLLQLVALKTSTLPAAHIHHSSSTSSPRRGTNSHNVTSSGQRRSEQQKQQFQRPLRVGQSGEYNVDSGIYSAGSSRDGTPIPNRAPQHQQVLVTGGGDHEALLAVGSSNSDLHPSVRSTLTTNISTPRLQKSYSEQQPDQQLDEPQETDLDRPKITRISSMSKMEKEKEEDEQSRVKKQEEEARRSPSPIIRSCSEKPLAPAPWDKDGQLSTPKRIVKSFPRSGKIQRALSPSSPTRSAGSGGREPTRSPSPLLSPSGGAGARDSVSSSFFCNPEDIKLVSGVFFPCHSDL